MSSSEHKDTSERTSNKNEEAKGSNEPVAQPAPVHEGNTHVPTEEDPISSQVLARWEQIRSTGKLPERRSYHSSVSYNNKVYIYGGYDIKEGDMHSMF